MNDDTYNQNLVPTDNVAVETPPLDLPIQDETLIAVMADAELRGKTVRQKLEIDKRSQMNVDFWKGKQVDESRLDARYQMAHVDNVVRQNLENKLKLATSKMPDIFVAPPDKQDFNTEAARDLQMFLRDRIDSATVKRLVKRGLRSMDLNFIGVIKPRWKYQEKDFCFELIDSNRILFGEGAKIYDDGYTIDGTEVIFHYVEESTQIVLNTFKGKADQLKELLQSKGEMPSRITYTECQFRWYDTAGNPNEGIAWRYDNLVLGKMKQPYYDYDNPKINYFNQPRKTYILFTYANLGESVYETTTDFEQGIPINRIINRRRRQITEIADRSVPKMVFTGGAMTKEQARNISNSPNEAIILNDTITNVRDATFIIPATPPNPILYNDILDLRGRLNSIFATHGQTFGESQGANQSGISKQISREGDMVTSDDLVDIVIERVVTEMTGWGMQFLRLFFDDDREPMRITDRDGETEHIELNRKKIETDVQVAVRASTTDKATRRADALQMLDAQAIDPFTLIEDLDSNNPKERMRRLVAWMESQKAGNLSRYMEIIGVDMDTHMADAKDAERDIDVLTQGQQVMIKAPSEEYVSTFMAFIQSPEFSQLDEATQANIQSHVQRLREFVDKQIAEKESEQGLDTQQLAQAEGAAQPEQGMQIQDTAQRFTGQQNPMEQMMGALSGGSV